MPDSINDFHIALDDMECEASRAAHTIALLNFCDTRARRVWPDIDSDLAKMSCISMLKASIDGVNIDVSSFAALNNLPRTTAYRILKNWESRGYCHLTKHGRQTIVVFSTDMKNKFKKFISEISDHLHI